MNNKNIEFNTCINQIFGNEENKKLLKLIYKFFENLRVGNEDVLKYVNKNLPHYLEMFGNFVKYLEELPDDIKKSIKILSDYGWYVEIYKINMFQVIFMSKSGLMDEKEVNKHLIKQYNEMLESILEKAVDLFPHREVFLRKAISAHKNRDYELSIPVLLAQIDGICFDFTKNEYFRKTKKEYNPKTSDCINSLEIDKAFELVLEPLKSVTPLSFHENEVSKQNKYILNRHSIMHGKDIEYATELNSCKVISFLAYIVSVFKFISDEVIQSTPNKDS